MFIELNLDYVRGVSSWAAVTKLSGDTMPALSAVNLRVVSEGGDIEVTVTDRYRIVYATATDAAASNDVGWSVNIPMDIFTRFVAATKRESGSWPVAIEVADDTVTFSLGNTKIVGDTIRGQYPNVGSLVRDWVAADSPVVSELFMNMKLLADVARFNNPNSPFVTPAKQPKNWRVRFKKGVEEGKAAAVMFDLGTPERFCVLVQPTTKVGH